MESMFRAGLAGVVLSLAATASTAQAPQSWIDADTRAMETKLGSVIEIGTTTGCLLCKRLTIPAARQPQAGQPQARQHVDPTDFHQSIRRWRARFIAPSFYPSAPLDAPKERLD